ncbi:MAG: TIGR01212 family radical SAM protein [Clostridia bacterium]|nr:TIGR01212 family radical SAM protein [Clostridia bacterium]
MDNLYNRLNEYYKNKFGERVLKICVDGGFTCPNRDGTKGVDGCIFCSERGSGEHIKYRDVSNQIAEHLASYRGQRANKFIVYFQNFSNTYANIEKLKSVYDKAFVSDKIVGISIATRPDCINNEVVNLLKEYNKKIFVSVELGLQTADDNIMNILNLKYTVKDFKMAVSLLKDAGINIVAHMMLGLPQESKESIDNTIELINDLGVDGIKIHNTYVVKNTKLEELYIKGLYKPLELNEYIEKLGYVLARLSPDIVIHRLSGDAEKDKLVAPDWDLHKKWIVNGITKYLKDNNLKQGVLYKSA